MNNTDNIPKKPAGFDELKNTYNPSVYEDTNTVEKTNGNSVNIEFEMTQLAKNGMKYTVLSTVQGKSLKEILDVIKGG